MRTAKEIIEEYKARGYNMESLRVLADSRDEPLRSEMLALLSNEPTPAAAEASASAEEMVFFVVGNEEEQEAEEVVSFDVLSSLGDSLHQDSMHNAHRVHEEPKAEPVVEAAPAKDDIAEEVACQAASSVFVVEEEPMAMGEESVAEILIGDDEGISFVQFDADGCETNILDYLPGMDIEASRENSVTQSAEKASPVEDEQKTESVDIAVSEEAPAHAAENKVEITADSVDSAIQMLLQAQNILVSTEVQPVAEEVEESHSDPVAEAVEEIADGIDNPVEQEVTSTEPEALEVEEANNNLTAEEDQEVTEVAYYAAEQEVAIAEPKALEVEEAHNPTAEDYEEVSGGADKVVEQEVAYTDPEAEDSQNDPVAEAVEEIAEVTDNAVEQEVASTEPEALEAEDSQNDPVAEAVEEIAEVTDNAVEQEVASTEPEALEAEDSQDDPIAEAMEDIAEDTDNALEHEVAFTEPELLEVVPTVNAAEAAEAEAAKLEAKAEKRRRRAERRRIKKENLKTLMESVVPLPEIVLSASEGTETLSEESCRELQMLSATSMEMAEESSQLAESAADNDFAMIMASGNMDMTIADLRTQEEAATASEEEEFALAFSSSVPEEADAGEEEVSFQNVIRLFDPQDEFAEFNGELEADSDEESGFAGSLLMLAASTEEEAAAESDNQEEQEPVSVGLSPLAKLGLVRALVGDPSVYDAITASEESVAEESGHVIVEAAAAPEPEYNAEFIAQIEQDYQTKLDDFTKQLLDLQTRTQESESKLREKSAELAEREKTLAETVSRLGGSENVIRDMTSQMAALSEEMSEKDRQLNKIQDMKTEHQRLFNEFEDLRKAYNEIVTDVMPTLQSERDELVLTVERQNEDEESLRSALKVSGRRMAVGYSLAAAAAVMMVVLPLTHWMGSDVSNQSLAMSHQQATDLQERLGKAEKRNVDAEKTIFDLERQTNLAKLELAKLEKANQELAAMTDHRTRELAVLKANLAGGSASARTVMAAGDNLAMSGPDNGRLRVNEVRDPGGSITNVLAENRERYAREDAMMASKQSRSTAGLQVSAVASTNSRKSTSTTAQKNARSSASKTEVASAANAAKANSGSVAVVKAGEGVAQVVYRVMGTRDPEVIAWVIRENNIKKDRRGNPRIYPDQKLTLPSADPTVKSASAAKR